MEKFIILKKDNDNYTLINENGNKYELSMIFYDLECDLKEGDKIAIHKELLNPRYKEYSNHYYFGPVNEIYGRKVTGYEDLDVIALQIDNKTITLKRFFG